MVSGRGRMKGNGQWSWEDGVSEWDYYKFTGNAPYSAPLSFQATLSTGQVVEGQVINSISSGASGTLSVSSAYTASDGAGDSSKSMSSCEMAAVICSVLAFCVLSALCFVCYRKRTKVIAAGVDDDEVIVTEMESDGAYNMTTIGSGDGQKTGDAQDNEAEIMIDVEITETRQ